jgi:3-hydroxyacyl-CoA dehydrogenase
MGPLELADFIGLDTCLSVMQVLHEGLADSARPCPLLVKYVEAIGRPQGQARLYDYQAAPGPDALEPRRSRSSAGSALLRGAHDHGMSATWSGASRR